MGETTSSNCRSWDTVRAGAFFPQPHFEVPQEKVRQHRQHHMVMPAGIFAHFIVRHPEFGFTFLKTLLYGPPDATEPQQGAEGQTRRGIADRIGMRGLRTKGALDNQPHGPLW